MSSIAVIGAGAWGTALAIQAARAGNQVTLWARAPARAAAIAARRENPRLPGAPLPDSIHITCDLPSAADLVLLAVPLQNLRGVVEQLAVTAPLICCSKGIETSTLRLPLEILAELYPDHPTGILTGPNFAAEIAAGQPAATVIATTQAGLRAQVADVLGTPGFRVYGNADPIGAQVGGGAKNVIAIAAGAVIGAGLGENARAGLVTRGLAELSRLAVALGGRAETVMGLSGLGDLLLTCTSPASRNYSLGLALGHGEALADILASRTAVTEGVATAPALIARAGEVEMPICRVVANLLAGRVDLKRAVAVLLSRRLRDE
ncbi:MAG TPA: NAD(P)H-dependent glycerol-3-phosphate dehydrogenase [Acetobacteraceae bacterium]|nr:NAD(P)H-dependent glycerol-3-phosphate dehydrogenase [Acetobacteraceae bacterium]